MRKIHCALGLVFAVLLAAVTATHAQMPRTARKMLHQAGQAYASGDYARADSLFDSALLAGASREIADYNLAQSLFEQKRFDEAADSFRSAERFTEDNLAKSEALYNMGNSYLQAQNLNEAIDAYKSALRLNPSDGDARHNLALAMKMLQEQEENEGDDDQDGDDGDDGDDENNDQSDGDDQNDTGDQNEGDDQNQEQKQDDQQGDQQQDRPQPKPGEISKEDAERMLEELNRRERELMQDLLKKKDDGKPKNIEKDW